MDNFISKNLAVQAETLKPIKEIQRNIDESLIRIRRFIQYLRPPTLEYLGLLPALRELANQVQEQSGIGIDLRVNGSERHLAPEQELLAYRIIQEAVRNVEKHSKAARAEINIEFDEDNITAIITDHGKGFEVNKSSKLLEKGKLGLMGMKERAHLLGGTLEISSKPNGGTTVTLNIRKKA
ncbi:Signal transduction histidine-protein kinase/phosphatase DegS [subsurface metagenome]